MTAPACAPRATLITSRYAGRCACGAAFQPGDRVAWSRSYEHPIVGCSGCDFGTFPGLSADALLDTARACMALADNGIKLRARDGSVGRLLTRNTLAADARRALLLAADGGAK
jgi:hypothetical protein